MPEDSPPEDSIPKPVPKRFLVAKGTLRFDRFMTRAIAIGGVGIIVAVFGIFVFILSQVFPLFGGATIELRQELAFGDESTKIIGLDEWSELPFAYSGGNEIHFTDLAGDRGTFPVPIPLDFSENEKVSAIRYHPGSQRITLGTTLGRFTCLKVNYKPHFNEGGRRTIIPEIETSPIYAIGSPESALIDIDYGDSGSAKLAAGIQTDGNSKGLHIVTLKQKRSLLGSGEIEIDEDFDLSRQLAGDPEHLLVSGQADGVIVADATGEVTYFFKEGDGFEVRQRFRPFDDLDDPRIARMDFVFGDVSIVFNGIAGTQRIFSLYRPPSDTRRLFGWTKTLPDLPEAASFFVASQRNKTILTGTKNFATLRYSTTESVRWETNLSFEIARATIDRKSETIAFLDTEARLHLYSLHDPHPEAGWKAFFGKIWYEGASQPEHAWQSSSASDDFEPKLSMTPLIIGSLKGTLYAMIFAVPIGVLAAIYTAQFLLPSVKNIIKPTMEIMASLPSVVLGFLAALWLAPVIETRIPSLILVVTALPASALMVGKFWSTLPTHIRNRLKPGYEYIAFAPIMLLTIWGMWELGPLFEKYAFSVTDETTGRTIADFRLWWPEVTGTTFEQRNSLVVGFMMGFAVIPVIFTISEDALSNVPPSLTAASAALGASRWQTVRTVVIPIASAGIFSALMIGFGRAVGETMIVVMATGNTPIMDWNIFSGMRTLSANIAVELPEAPVHSTHYRTLFLGALVLFLLTFVLNTIAEILRQHLREKFKLI